MAKGYPMRISEEEATKRIKEKTQGRFSYVSGYKTKESKIDVQCSKCGAIHSWTYHHITTHGIKCPTCRKIKRDKERAERLRIKEEKRREKEEALAKRRAEKERQKAERNKPHRCPVCGELTIRPKYCSDRCLAKANNSTKEARRRRKVNKAMVDKDITVQGLFKRDKGICYICGCKCDWKDFTEEDDVFIAGNSYPSIDHVIPLARGGLHSWNNVKLAHRLCNSKKSDGILQQ